MCDAPLLLKTEIKSLLSRLLSPVSSAVMMAVVSAWLNGIDEIVYVRFLQNFLHMPATVPGSVSEPDDMKRDVDIQTTPVANAVSDMQQCALMTCLPSLPYFPMNMAEMMTTYMQVTVHKMLAQNGIDAAASIPTANENANPEISLSSVISTLIFDNVAIIFVTLRGLT